MHRIGFFVCRGYDALDLGGPLSAFNQVATAAGHTPYDLHVISPSGGPIPGNTGLSIDTKPVGRRAFDTVVFVGGDIAPMQTSDNIAAASKLAAKASRVASVCTGAFLLAETGSLDGLKAATHWRYAAQLQSRFPRTRVDGDSIYVVDGRVWTSAGIASGIDLALGMIERDMSTEIAREVSRLLVVPYRRPGGQSQFSAMSQMEPESDRIRITLNFAREHLAEALPVERLADAASLSVRQFGRAFRRETGETPARAVERLRVEAARLRLQGGRESPAPAFQTPVEPVSRQASTVPSQPIQLHRPSPTEAVDGSHPESKTYALQLEKLAGPEKMGRKCRGQTSIIPRPSLDAKGIWQTGRCRTSGRDWRDGPCSSAGVWRLAGSACPSHRNRSKSHGPHRKRPAQFDDPQSHPNR